MLILKLWYFLYFAGASSLYPYFNLIFRRQGLSAEQIGTIAGVRPWIGLTAGALLSSIADKWRVHRLVLLGTLATATLGRGFVSQLSTYTTIFVAMLASDAILSPVTIIADAVSIAACPGEGEYARQRLWGAVGWGVFSLISGLCIHWKGPMAAFILYGVLSVATLTPSAFLPWKPLHQKLLSGRQKLSCSENTRASGDEENSFTNTILGETGSPVPQALEGEVNVQRGIYMLVSRADVLLFFSQVTVMGYAVGTIEGFLFLYLEDLGGSEALMGLTLTVTCVAETLVFYWIGVIVRCLGLDRCFHVCFAAFSLRLLGYTTLPAWGTLWAVLPFELLHGITFGLTWSAGTMKSALIAPPGLEATTQSAFQGLMFGLGHGIGGLASGAIYQHYGPQSVFGSAFCVVITGWGLTTAMDLAAKRLGKTELGNVAYKAVATVELTTE